MVVRQLLETEGMHRGLMGVNSGLGATARGGGTIVGGGVNSGGVFNLLRTALHTISISLQNSLS